MEEDKEAVQEIEDELVDDDEFESGLGPDADGRPSRRRVREGSRPKVLARHDLRRATVEARADYQPSSVEDVRPKVRGDCAGGQRPCPWVSCRYHLYLSVNPETGAITLHFPDLEPDELKETCALDVAERGGITLEEVGELTNLTRERIRQIEVRALVFLKADPATDALK